MYVSHNVCFALIWDFSYSIKSLIDIVWKARFHFINRDLEGESQWSVIFTFDFKVSI